MESRSDEVGIKSLIKHIKFEVLIRHPSKDWMLGKPKGKMRMNI